MRWVLGLLLAVTGLQGSRLPIRTYTTADGLARDFITCIVQDSHGFLWFCTAEGLSRFDGYQFTNYRTEQGLPSNLVSDMVEARQGVYWLATSGGLVRFEPAAPGAARFRRYPLRGRHGEFAPWGLYQDRGGGIWCGTSDSGAGLFHLDPHSDTFRQVDLPMADGIVSGILVDRRGALWVGSPAGLIRRGPDGKVETYTAADGLPDVYIMCLLEGHDGRIWVGTRGGLVRLDAAGPGAGLRLRVYHTKDGLPSERIESLLETSGGRLWVGTNQGLAEWTPGEPDRGRVFQAYTLAQGLSARSVSAMEEDRDGNLWVGTYGSGAMKVARSGFVTYSDSDGVAEVQSLMESRRGELCVWSRSGKGCQAAVFDGRSFTAIQPAWPRRITYFGWGRGQIAVHDRAGEWWVATGQGLCRFARAESVRQLGGARPKAVYTAREGLPGNNIFRVFEDSHGDIWVGTLGSGLQDGLARWNRATGRMQVFSEADGLPERAAPSTFAEDRAGDIWVALFHGGLARYRKGRFTHFTEADGIPHWVGTLFVDSAARLWIGTFEGLVRVDDPARERPRFVTYGTAQGLSSSDIHAVTEDGWGRIYAATGRGIDRFEPQAGGPGRIRHYTSAEGVAPGSLQLALRDGEGKLWFGTPLGISQLTPAPDRPRPPPPVLITQLRIGGIPRALSDLGETAVAGLRLARSSLRVDFVGLGFSPGEALRYQYKLEGADADWSGPTDQRTVLYASLAPGSYRFLVRAVASDGATSPAPARVAFTVLPPLWRTWWFVALCAALLTLLIYALHRYRLAQVLAVANVRARIATDLHDDIGASLSQIAILSEVARQAVNGNAPGAPAPLAEIAGISREVIDSLSDIVWAINPEHDRLSNLLYRMRRFAGDVLEAQNIGLQFRSTVADHELRIGADVRRQVYLIFKEGIHNIARHSGAGRVQVDLEGGEERLVLRLRDDGKGFDPAAEYEGHGLASIRKRAAALGGTAEWESAPGPGATLTVTVRLQPARTLSMLRGKTGARFR